MQCALLSRIADSRIVETFDNPIGDIGNGIAVNHIHPRVIDAQIFDMPIFGMNGMKSKSPINKQL